MDPPCRHEEKRSRKRRKMRSLMQTEKCKNTRRNCSSTTFLIITFLIALVLTYYIGKYAINPKGVKNVNSFFNDFKRSYHQHYNQIVHGSSDYCTAPLNTQILFHHIRGQTGILNQEEALQALQITLSNETRINSIAIAGPSGVGKSLWAHALGKCFPWQENVHSYAWNTHVRDEVEKFHVLRMFANQLSDCGQNLLIIDNLPPCDREVVNLLNNLVDEVGKENNLRNLRVTIVYIFNLNTMMGEDEYERQFNMVQDLPDTTTVNFNRFDKDELEDCIRYEASTEQLTLSDESFNEIIKSIDASQSGCKMVHSKLITIGQIIQM